MSIKKLKTNIHTLIHNKHNLRNVSWILTGKTSSFVASLFIMVSFSFLAPKETYGAYKYVLSFFAIASLFSLPGINSIVSKSIARGEESFLFRAEEKKSKWAMVGSFILLAAGSWYLYKANYILGCGFLIAGATLPLETVSRLFSFVWQGKMDFKKQGLSESVGFVLPALLLIGTLFLTDNLLLILGVYFSSYSAVRLSLYLQARGTIKKTNLTTASEKDHLSTGWHLTATQFIEKFSNQIDKILVWHVGGGPVAVAILSFAQMPMEQLREFFPIQTLLLPKLSKLPKKEALLFVKKNLKRLLLIFIPITIGIFFVTPFIYKLIFPQYEASIKLFQILSIGTLLIPFTLFDTYLISHSNIRGIYITQAIPSLIKIVLFIILIPVSGIIGAVYASLFGSVAGGLIKYYLFTKSIKHER